MFLQPQMVNGTQEQECNVNWGQTELGAVVKGSLGWAFPSITVVSSRKTLAGPRVACCAFH